MNLGFLVVKKIYKSIFFASFLMSIYYIAFNIQAFSKGGLSVHGLLMGLVWLIVFVGLFILSRRS